MPHDRLPEAERLKGGRKLLDGFASITVIHKPGSTIEEARAIIKQHSPLEPKETAVAGTISRAGEILLLGFWSAVVW